MKQETKEKRDQELIKKLCALFPLYTFIKINNEANTIIFLCSKNHIVENQRNWLTYNKRLFCWECEKERSKITIEKFLKILPPTIQIKSTPSLFKVGLICTVCNDVFVRNLNRNISTIRCTNCIQTTINNKQLQRKEIVDSIKSQVSLKELKITGIIYMLTFPDGQKYVGQTIQLKERIKRHMRDSRNPSKVSFYTSLGKHLKQFNNNFKIDLLHQNVNWEQLNDLETQEIKNHDSYHNGLNDTEGGQNGLSVRYLKIKEIYDRELRKDKELELKLKQINEKKELSNFEKGLKKSLKEFQKTYEDNVEKELEKQRQSFYRSKKQSQIANDLVKGNRQKSSVYRGVSFDKKNNKWKANIKHNGKKIHIGLFDTQEQAAIAYNNKAIQLKGNLAILNIVVP